MLHLFSGLFMQHMFTPKKFKFRHDRKPSQLTTYKSLYFSRGWRRIGRPFTRMGEGLLYMTFSFGSTFSHLNLVTILWIHTSISSQLYSFLGHSRGPPPNGTKVYGAGPFPPNLEGSNFYGSRKYLGFLFVVCTLQYVCKKMKIFVVISHGHET